MMNLKKLVALSKEVMGLWEEWESYSKALE